MRHKYIKFNFPNLTMFQYNVLSTVSYCHEYRELDMNGLLIVLIISAILSTVLDNSFTPRGVQINGFPGFEDPCH